MKKFVLWMAAGILATLSIAAIGTRVSNVVAPTSVQELGNVNTGQKIGGNGTAPEILYIFPRKNFGYGLTVWKENVGATDSLQVVLDGAMIANDTLAWKILAKLPSNSTYLLPTDSTAGSAVSYTYTGFASNDSTRTFQPKYFRIRTIHFSAGAGRAGDTCRVFFIWQHNGDRLDY